MFRSASVMVFLASNLVMGGGGCEGCVGTENTIQRVPDESGEIPLTCEECMGECPPAPECPECPEPDPDDDLDAFTSIEVQSGTVMLAPAGTTQANAWIQVQCPDSVDLLNCSDQQVVLRSVRVWSVQAGEFEPVQDFCPGTDLEQDVQWSMEYHLRGVNNNVSGGAEFYSPADGVFTIHDDCGLQFRVPSGWYAAPMSCDIDESCDNRTAEAGAQYYWDVEVCRLSGSQHPEHELVFRTGFDWLSCRGSQCPDGNDDWLDETHTPWFSLPDRTCVHVSP